MAGHRLLLEDEAATAQPTFDRSASPLSDGDERMRLNAESPPPDVPLRFPSRRGSSSAASSSSSSPIVALSLPAVLCVAVLVLALFVIVAFLLVVPIPASSAPAHTNLLILSVARYFPSLLKSFPSLLTESPRPPVPADHRPPVPVNLHRLARLADRLHRGLPVLVTGIGGSNMQGAGVQEHSNPTFLQVVVEWLNERFPVDRAAVAAELLRLNASFLSPEALSDCPHLVELRSAHVADNRAIGGTRSSMASFCIHRLLACARHRPPDLVLVDYSINDWIVGDDAKSDDPSINVERLLRQTLGIVPHAAVMLANFPGSLTTAMVGAEAEYHAAAVHYHVPELSMRRFSEEFLWQRDVQTEHPWHRTPDPARRLLPDRLALPLPAIVRDKAPALDWNRALWKDEFHLNDAGHQMLATLANREILHIVDHLRFSNWTAIANPLLGDDAPAPIHVLFLSRPVASLPLPLHRGLLSADAAAFQCFLLYHPYNPRAAEMDQAEAEAFLGVVNNDGWQYRLSPHAYGKFSLEVGEDRGAVLGQRFTIRLPHEAHSVTVAHLRTWNASLLGNASAWLSCELSGAEVASSTADSTPRVTLPGLWSEGSTQAGSTHVWPVTEAAGTGTASPSCALQYMHVEHTTVGDFRFIGYMIN